jgi:hypothetical protein
MPGFMEGFGDIAMNSKRFRIEIGSWREKDIIDFAPRATVPGGSVVMSDLGLFQPLVQTDWQHGFGFHWYSDAQGYLYTSGNIDTRQDGLVMLMTSPVSSDTNGNAKEGFVTFNGVLYSYGAAGLRKFNGTTWSSVYSTAAVNHAINAGDYLLFCPDGLRIQKMNSSETITNAGLDANATDYRWLAIHNGFIYAGKDATNKVHFDTNPDLSALEGTTADTDIIYCGIGNVPTITGISFGTILYVTRQDGIWSIGDDRIARRAVDYSNEMAAANFRSAAVINGFLVFPIRDRVIQWNGARVQDITPPKITDTFPYVTYGRFDNFVATDNFLFMSARTNETSYVEDLLVWDGTAWHKLMNLVPATATAYVSAMGYDVVNNRLWYHVVAGISSTNTTYYIQFQSNSSFPYANFPTTGTHSLITSRLDMGFRRVIKSLNSLLVEARNVTSARYIDIYYQLDGEGDWRYWDRVDKNGVIEIKNPGHARSREFNYALLRFDFITDSAANSPILESYTMRFIMRPDVLWGYSFYVLAATEQDDEHQSDARTSDDIRQQLLAIRNSKSPVELIDPWGISHFGYLTSVQGSVHTRHDSESDDIPDIENRILCNFAEIENAFEE